jgi:hypothetical protein
MEQIIALALGALGTSGASIEQWASIVEALWALEPDVAKFIADASPIAAKLFAAKGAGLSAAEAVSGIPGYASDGSVITIANPYP